MGKILNILFIDDDKDDIEILKAEMQKKEYEINYDQAFTENQIRESINKKWDIIILDYFLPELSAKKVLELLNESGNITSIIIVSNTQINNIPSEVFKLGAKDFINKDKLHRLVYSIERELDQQKHKKELNKLKSEFRDYQQSLEEQNHFFTQLIEATSNPIFYKNTSRVYLGCNQAFADFLGKTKEEIIGKTVYDISPKELAVEYEKRDKEFFKNPITQKYEYQVMHANGTYMDVLFYKNPLVSSKGTVIGLVGHMINITERKKAEKRLEESQQRYKFLSDVTTEGIVLHEHLLPFDMNESFERITGFSREELLNRNLLELIPYDEDKKLIELNVKQKTDKPYQVRLKTKQGKLIIAELEARNYQVREKGFRVVAVRDVSDKIQIQKEIRESRIKYEKLVEDMHEGMGITDFNEKIVYTNTAFDKIFGYSHGDLLGKNLMDFIPEKDHKKIEEETQKRKTGERSEYNVNIIRRDGTHRMIKILATPWVEDTGRVSGTIALIMDVTQQEKFNTDLKRRYEFEKKIFDISSRFLNSEDFNQKVILSLQDLGKLTNSDRIYILIIDHKNKTFSITKEWCDDGIDEIRNMYQNHSLKTIEWGMNMLATREQIYIKDVNTLPDEAKAFKAYFEKNNVTGFIGFPIFIGLELAGIIGVSNPQKTKEYSSNEFILLRNAGEVLSNAIQRKLAEDQINNLNDKLINKAKELEQVLYVTSHDIRSPLVNIVGFTKELNKAIDELNELMVKEQITPEDKKNINYLLNEDIPEILKFINAGGVKIDRLLYGLLKLSRLGRSMLEYSKVDINKIINEIAESFEFQIQTNKIDITVGEFSEFVSDPNLLSQVLSNLIDNAIKYYDENKKSFIKIINNVTKDSYEIIVEDNGVGIPEDKKDKVFEIFNRLKPEVAEGEGIGLTIIKKGVERLGGKISLESKENVGCKFTLSFPVS